MPISCKILELDEIGFSRNKVLLIIFLFFFFFDKMLLEYK